MAKEGEIVTASQLCRRTGLARSTSYYKEKDARKAKINERLAGRIKRVIDALPYTGYRTVAFMLGENKNNRAAHHAT